MSSCVSHFHSFSSLGSLLDFFLLIFFVIFLFFLLAFTPNCRALIIKLVIVLDKSKVHNELLVSNYLLVAFVIA